MPGKRAWHGWAIHEYRRSKTAGFFLRDGNGLIFPTLYFDVERMVRAFEELLGCLARLIIRPASGEAKRNLLLFNLNFQLGQAAEDMLNLVRVALGQQRHKLVAADSPAIRSANRFAEALAKRLRRRSPAPWPQR